MDKFTIGIFDVVILRQGDRYGLDKCLIHDTPDPRVEFWNNQTGEFFCRYHADTLINPDSGLWSDGRDEGICIWSVPEQEPVSMSYKCMMQVRKWLREQIS